MATFANLVIPMAGQSSSFSNKGIKTPKPFIDIFGKPMVQHAFESLDLMPYVTPIFVITKNHDDCYNACNVIKEFCPGAEFVVLDSTTSYPAESLYKAKPYINSDKPLIQSNVDQILQWDSDRFLSVINRNDPDGAVITVKTTDPHYSYIKVDYTGKAIKLTEKEVISNRGLIGTHYWKRGDDFIWSYEVAKQQGINYNGELYISQTYNPLIEAGHTINDYRLLDDEKQYPVGDPKQLNEYTNKFPFINNLGVVVR